MKIRLEQKLAQKMALTPQMKQSIHILQLPLLELRSYLEAQLEENPVLEDERGLESKDSLQDEKITKLVEQSEEYSGESNSSFDSGYSHEEMQKRQRARESLIIKEPTLQEHLIRQLGMHPLNEAEYKIGEFIISHIDENGYFQDTTDEVTRILISKGTDVKPEDSEKILSLIQTFDPAGIGARNLKECLIIQLKAKGKQDSLCFKIIENHLPDLARNKTKQVAKILKVPLIQIKDAIKQISQLEPKPGRAFAQSAHRKILPASPDIILDKTEAGLQVLINGRGLPQLRISKYYKNLMNKKDVSKETKNFLREKISSGLGLIKAVMQRQETIQKIADCIINIQRDFFEQGREELLKPLTLKEVATLVGRNESTISRVVNNKYIQTPFGIFKLDYFFSTSLKTKKGELISSEAVRSQIASLIAEEDAASPLSDDKIVKHFTAQGINIARRTIAKYRKELGILSSHQRKKSQ